MKNQTKKCRIVEAVILLFVIGCLEEKTIRSTKERETLASSIFYPGELAAGAGLVGSDTGKIPTPRPTTPPQSHPLSFSLDRVCSTARSQSNGLFFEHAAHPILSLETNYSPNCITAGSDVVPVQCAYYYSAPAKKNIMLVKTIDLSAVNLLKERYTAESHVDLSGLQAKYPETWENAVIQAAVCDDTNGDGRCSDESLTKLLSMLSPFLLFHAKRFPQKLALIVWSGKNLTVQENPKQCELQLSPLVLDLKGDGISLTGPQTGVQFDLNDDNQLEYTGWVTGKDDAFLVRDLNGNGGIDSGAELFGSSTRLKSGKRAPNGFEALKDLDDNGDGLFTHKDNAWHLLGLWIDKNANGMSEKWELSTLKRAQIVSINLNYVEMMEADPYGNQTRQRSTFMKQAGEGKTLAGLIVDIWFSTLIMQ